ncbi:Uma2 family endonuclease [Saccharopolyspora gloriosae]|uniref:Uma2 family endonuclease n=1 Tax=Saccharopolyspora gloriosae TaxID=455344 RepID=A0A840ND65_9PSEU|nr:Uma2 family endonuclease [Saccharopolyspora gloriosae]MBB5067279.1 Uma2 family endonuclease [Saccharopolyspora gloriosae]
MSSALAYASGPPFTLADWESLEHDPDGNRVELIGGHFQVTPAPSYVHQGLNDELRLVLRQALRAEGRSDLFAVSGIGVSLFEGMGFIPDISVLQAQRDGTVKVEAAEVLLAVEIVSPRTRKDDRMIKPDAYAQAGVPFYWRVEPIPGDPPTILCFELTNGVYVKSCVVESGVPATVKAAPVPVDLDVDVLYDLVFGGA